MDYRTDYPGGRGNLHELVPLLIFSSTYNDPNLAKLQRCNTFVCAVSNPLLYRAHLHSARFA
jgi:hypothetical protein